MKPSRKLNQESRSTAHRVSGTGISDSRHAASVPNFLRNAAQTFGKEWETVCVYRITRTTATNPKQEKESHEKSKYSVQTNSRTSHPAVPRLLCGSVYLGLHSGSSPRHGALQWHCVGVRRVSVRHGVRAFNTRHQLRTREPIGSLHGNSGILPAPVRPRSG